MFEKLSKDRSELLTTILLSELSNAGKDIEIKNDDEMPFLSQIIKKRIDVLKLPIKFTNMALMAINAFTTVPGGAVVLLIDALDRFEGQEITAGKLCHLYPDGFYTNEALTDKIDGYKEDCRQDKTEDRKFKWSPIYGGL